MPENLAVGVVALVAGLLVGFGIALMVRRSIALNSETTARATADRLLAEARTKQKDIILEAKDEALNVAKAAENENRERRAELQRYESRLDKKDEQLDTQVAPSRVISTPSNCPAPVPSEVTVVSPGFHASNDLPPNGTTMNR